MVIPNDYLRLNKPLYGTCDSGDYWGTTFTQHVWKEMKMMPMIGDPSLYVKKVGSTRIRMLRSYVYDCMFAGDRTFDRLVEYTRTNFASKSVE